MSNKKILKDLNEFYDGMTRAQKILDSFSVEFSNKLDSIGKELDSLATLTEELRCSENLPTAKLLNSEIDNWNLCIKECSKAAKSNVTGQNFQNRFEKFPLVIVFGIVKAGKSTLGNFLHGRTFRAADFDNVYKTVIPKSEIIVEESGRKDQKKKEEFDENSIESTCSAQYFQIPGLAWVDTPGIGAIQKSSDLRPLEEIAKQYVRYADLVVFLSSSDQPEVIESIFSYQDLYKEGKKLLIAITRSDVHESKPNVITKKIDRILVPKDPERRKLQENSLLASLKKAAGIEKGLDAISISTLLAEHAVQNQDDSDWEGSNMGSFYQKIIDVIGNKKILDLKKEAPKRQLNSSIDIIIGKNDDQKSLTSLINKMQTVQNLIKQKYDELSPDGDLVSQITEDVINQLRSAIRKHVEKETRENSQKTQDITLEGQKSLVQKTVISTLESHIAKLVGEYYNIAHGEIETDGISGTAEHRKGVHSYDIQVSRSVERDPHGFVENVKSFFGKKYYKVEYKTETRTIDIDLGVNTVATKKALLTQLEGRVTTFVQNELESIRKQFFGLAQEKLGGLIQKLENMKKRLEQFRY